MISVEQKEMIKKGINALAARCDGAVQLDKAGFNGYDAPKGHLLAALTLEEWTEADTISAAKMVKKYRRQLEGLGLEMPDIEVEEIKERIVVGFDSGKYTLRFKYDPFLIESLKRRVRRREFIGEKKTWEIDASEYEALKGFLESCGFHSEAANLPKPEIKEGKKPEPDKSSRVEDGGKEYKIFFRYNPDVVAKIREVPGRRFVGKDKAPEPYWAVPKTKVAMLSLLPMLREEGFNIPQEIEEEIKTDYDKGQANISGSKAETVETSLVIEGLKGELYPFQKAAVKYVRENKRVIIADEPGLGKTIEALAAAHSLDAYPIIVVCPASLKLNWKLEAEKWLVGKTTSIWDSKNKEKADIIIINYDMLSKLTGDLRAVEPQTVILDESHYIKNRKSQRANAAKEIAKGVEVVIELTGTPVMNRAEELINQLAVIGRLEDMGGAWTILKRYCWSTSRTEEFNQNLRATCFVRREKSTVLKELPKKQRVVMPVSVNLGDYNRKKKQVIEYIANKMKEDADLMARVEAAKTKEEKKAIVKEYRKIAKTLSALLPEIEELKQIAAEAKMPAVIEWIKSFIETEKKLVVFAHHQKIVKAIAEEFGVPYINQETSLNERQRQVEAFQNDPNVNLIIGTLGTMGVGLTLTAATDVLIVELGWNAAQVDQAEDRIHRIGQDGSVTAWYMLAEGTIENELMAMIEQKRALATEITEGKESVSNETALSKIIETLMGEREG